ncbi:MAG: T9SS type A sorting domain-containing protein [Bacteroidota bacterium]|nr:T9SS type A sorting domain-containing protein [Bacteroidota bacterium]
MNPKLFLYIIFAYICLFDSWGNAKNKYSIYVEQLDLVKPPIIYGINVLNENELQITFEKQKNNHVAYYNIYRNSIPDDAGWTLIGRGNYQATACFRDINAYPDRQSYEYKVSFVDSCGYEIFSPNIHKSIQLKVETLTNGYCFLRWNAYEGLKIESYHVLKGSSPNNMILIDSINGSTTNYIDNSFLNENEYYKVEAYGYLQDSTIADEYKTKRIKVQSNISFTQGDNSLSHKDENIKFYPNPLTEYSIVAIPYDSILLNPIQVCIFNTMGKLVYQKFFYSNAFLLERGNLKDGLYILQVSGSTHSIYRKKIIVGTLYNP